MNLRPPGYEPGELPDCSTPRRWGHHTSGLFWIALAFFVVAPVAGLTYAVVQGLGAWRSFRRFTSALGATSADFGARVDAMGSREPFDSERLGQSLDRLRRSNAQLSILVHALARVRTQWSALLAVYPRK